MALGFKLKTVKTSQSFANEKELFDRIKDEAFTAGKPELVKNGFADVIVFPPLDRQNQVWVMVQGKNKILIQKNQMMGVGDQLVNAAFDTVTHGIFSIGSVFGGNVKESNITATPSSLFWLKTTRAKPQPASVPALKAAPAASPLPVPPLWRTASAGVRALATVVRSMKWPPISRPCIMAARIP